MVPQATSLVLFSPVKMGIAISYSLARADAILEEVRSESERYNTSGLNLAY